MTRWLLCALGVAAVLLALKIGSFFVVGRLDADDVATRLAAKHGAAASSVLCSGPELVNSVWEAVYTPWATFRYSCPEVGGGGGVDLLSVTVRDGRIVATAG
jgi:hypothetical protein